MIPDPRPFIAARLDEDQAAAVLASTAAGGGQWAYDTRTGAVHVPHRAREVVLRPKKPRPVAIEDLRPGAGGGLNAPPPTRLDLHHVIESEYMDDRIGEHFARHHPTRSLYEVAALRAVLKAHPLQYRLPFLGSRRPDGSLVISCDEVIWPGQERRYQVTLSFPGVQGLVERELSWEELRDGYLEPKDDPVLVDVARIWHDHPDFDDAWADPRLVPAKAAT